MTIKQLPSLKFLETAVNALKKMEEQENKWRKTFNEMFDGHFVSQYNNVARNAIIKMVEEIFDDKDSDGYGSMFSWWIYDTNFGKNRQLADSVRYKDKKVPMHTIKNLYDYYLLVSDKKEN